MPRDRLPEYRFKANITDEAGNNIESHDEVTEENIPLLHPNSGQVAMVKRLTTDLKSTIDKVEHLHVKILSTPNPDKQINAELDEAVSSISVSSDVIRAKLKVMERSYASEDETYDCRLEAMARMRQTQYSALMSNFRDAVHQYQFAQVKYRDGCKARIKRQLSITTSKFSDDEVEEMIDKGNFSVFTQENIMENKQAKQMLAEVEARHDGILKLEKSLLDMHHLFTEMAGLVEDQGCVVDSIATRVALTQGYVAKAKEEVVEAKKYKDESTKKTIYISVALSALVVVVALIIWAAVH